LKNKVLAWIEENFIISEIEVIDFPAFPGGQLIRDKQGGEMVVYYDIATEQVKHEFKNERR
jgi:hypothetical protein